MNVAEGALRVQWRELAMAALRRAQSHNLAVVVRFRSGFRNPGFADELLGWSERGIIVLGEEEKEKLRLLKKNGQRVSKTEFSPGPCFSPDIFVEELLPSIYSIAVPYIIIS